MACRGRERKKERSLKVLLMQNFQTAATVLTHRLPHSAKPHARILPQRGIRMSKFGTKNKDSKKAEEKKVRQQLAALERKKAKAAAKKK